MLSFVTDPFLGWTFQLSVGQAMAAGAISGFIGGGVMTGSLSGAFNGAIFGAFSGGLAKGIGLSKLRDFGRAMAHGVTQAALSKGQGGTYRSGFWAGFMSSYLPAEDFAKSNEGQAVASAVVGGTASVLGGGKFENGAMSGAFVYLFNHAAKSRRAIRERQKRATEIRKMWEEIMSQNDPGLIPLLLPASTAPFHRTDPYGQMRRANSVNLIRAGAFGSQAGFYSGVLIGSGAPVAGSYVYREATIFVLSNPVRATAISGGVGSSIEGGLPYSGGGLLEAFGTGISLSPYAISTHTK